MEVKFITSYKGELMKKIILFALICIMLSSISLFAKQKVRMGVVLSEKNDEQVGLQIKRVVEDSPAGKAGLMTKDLLMKIDGDKIYTVDQVKRMLSFYEPGQKIQITYKRGEEINTCRLKLEEKKRPEFPKRTYMGVFLQDLDEKLKDKLKIAEPFGIMISEVVKNSPADIAGLKDNDILLSFANEKIYTSDQLVKMLQNHKPKDEIEVKILRGKKFKKLKIILGEKEDKLNFLFSKKTDLQHLFETPENILFYQYDYSDHNKWIGVELDINKVKTVKDGETIVKMEQRITNVIEGTPAEKAGLKKDDVIIAVENDKELEISKALKDKEIGDEITLTIERDGKNRNIEVGIGQREITETDKDIGVSIVDGEIKILINGIEKNIEDLKHLRDGLDEVEIIKGIKLDVLEDVKDEIEKASKQMKHIDLDIEIYDDQEL